MIETVPVNAVDQTNPSGGIASAPLNPDRHVQGVDDVAEGEIIREY